MPEAPDSEGYLLAVDLGVRTGLALYGREGRLLWYRSKNYGNLPVLKRGVQRLLNDFPDISDLVIEGRGEVAAVWMREARRKGIAVLRIDAEQWREGLFYPREYDNGIQAKRNATMLARRVIEWAKAPKSKSLRHDAAEAILIGLWASMQLGRLERVPGMLR